MKVQNGETDGKSTVPFWESVESVVVVEQVWPVTNAHTLPTHYSPLVADLEKGLPDDQFESLSDKLKTKGRVSLLSWRGGLQWHVSYCIHSNTSLPF
jgi:hypothetical protein